jgi:hypothetical protein
MKNFREYVSEETIPVALNEASLDVSSQETRDEINIYLNGVTSESFITPYVALERVRKVLATYHVFLPASVYLDGSTGVKVFGISQFGDKIGMDNDGNFKTNDSSPYFVYFEYVINEEGGFDIFSEIVTQDELDEILEDMDSEDEEENEEV